VKERAPARERDREEARERDREESRERDREEARERDGESVSDSAGERKLHLERFQENCLPPLHASQFNLQGFAARHEGWVLLLLNRDNRAPIKQGQSSGNSEKEEND